MMFSGSGNQVCKVCGKDYWGIPTETCGPCEAIVRSWTSKGFLELCRYLEKVTAFEAFCASQESSDDPAPAEGE